jgi:hypothetical protein
MADATIDRITQGAHRIALQGDTMRDPEVAAQMQGAADPKLRRDGKKEANS